MFFTYVRRVSAVFADRCAVEAQDRARLMGYLGALR
jgi:hypothetical protein